jgi:LCP family protein required for cell wall assembly
MLILGADMRPGDKQANSDTLILARVDPANKHIALISIPRDTRAAIPGHGTEKINAAMMYGGPSLVIQTVRQLTGLPVSHFVQVNFWGFKQMVDAVGGVWVNVPYRIVDLKAATHDQTAYIVEAGHQKLDGKHALTFVRSRHFAMADYVRMKDQQIFIKALVKQTLQAGNVFRINAITDAMLKNVVTDMKVDQILSLVSDFKDMNPKTIETATMPSTPKMVYGIDYVVLDDAAMRDMIAKLAAGQPIDKTAQASAVAAASQAASSVVDPKTVTVEVRNGAGGKAVASTNAARLSAAGFAIQKTGNAARFVYPQTLVIYRDDQGAAQAVQAALGFGTVVKSENRYAFTSKVLVVVGKDWTAASANGSPAAPAQ